MADDGMLMNFNLGDGIISAQQKFKGGTWKDRLAAKKIAVQRQNKPKQPGSSTNANNSPIGERRPTQDVNRGGDRAPKRQKLDTGPFKPSSTTIPSGGQDQGQAQARNPHAHLQREVISSLFSYNPVEKVASAAEKATQKQDDNDAEGPKASNAPLVDGIDTFTSLGLSPIIAAHLLTKLNLKDPTAIQKSAIPQLLKEECDAFVQAETGSGKTLAYLLPLIQRIMNISSTRDQAGKVAGGSENNNAFKRDSGLFAIVLAPTRELCKQISVVLEGLLRCAHWIVGGTVIGGEKKKSEKARLRKGLNILVATPGRLADHLDNTQVLDVSNVRWLVMDEGDRLVDLGFEEEIQGIIKKLDARKATPSSLVNLPSRRTTILCSATLKMNVQRLGEISLKDAIHVKSDPADGNGDASAKENSEFSAPAQLKQTYVVAAAKLRLVTLTALLKRTFARKGSVMKAIVFVSCADSVDFHFEVFRRELAKAEEGKEEGEKKEKQSKDTADPPSNTDPTSSTHGTVASAPTLSNPSNPVTIHRLHGSLPQHVRTATLSAFSKQKDTSVMICTDVAARGLDLPNVDFVVEYDPAFCSDDHLHRIGRTARLGRDGRALIFLLPGNEEGYIEVLKSGYRDDTGKSVSRNDTNQVLKQGFGANNPTGKGWEEAATEWQLDVERWTLDNPTMLEMGRRAFQSHVRAYATHIANERSMFNIKDLHLGHLAKSFALRDKPANINVPGLRTGKDETKKSFKAGRNVAGDKKDSGSGTTSFNPDTATAAQKMRRKLKEHMSGASEFNIA